MRWEQTLAHLLPGERATCLTRTTSSKESDSCFQRRNYGRRDSYGGFDVPGGSLLWRGVARIRSQPLNKRDDPQPPRGQRVHTIYSLSSRVVKQSVKKEKQNNRDSTSISPRGRSRSSNEFPLSTIGKSLKVGRVWNARAVRHDKKNREKREIEFSLLAADRFYDFTGTKGKETKLTKP